MDTLAINNEFLDQQCSQKSVDLVDFYNKATSDYRFWSRDYNMHFGYFVPFRTNPFKRDTMLNEMNRQVLKRLDLNGPKSVLADLGCGMGATMRYALERFKNLGALGVTLSDFQATEGNRLLAGMKGAILQEDFNNTSLPSNVFDGAVAIESFCHAGHNIQSFREAHRILKPGGKLVIADAFLKKKPERLCPAGALSYKKLCDHWGLDRLGDIKTVESQLQKAGFTEVRLEDISPNVAPSVLHVPFAILGFLVKTLLCGKPLGKESLHNLKGSFYALLCGFQLKSFGYYLVRCTK